MFAIPWGLLPPRPPAEINIKYRPKATYTEGNNAVGTNSYRSKDKKTEKINSCTLAHGDQQGTSARATKSGDSA